MVNDSQELTCLPRRQQREFQQDLAGQYDNVPDYLLEEPLWSPYFHSTQQYETLISVQKALQSGLMALHQALPEDARLHRLLAPRYGSKTRHQFAVLKDLPLADEFIRPDYIVDQQGMPRICEINARFIFNGNIAGVHIADFLAQRFGIDNAPYQRLDRFMHKTYDGPGTTVISRGMEPYHDLMLQQQRSETSVTVRPETIRLLSAKKIGRLILELHQRELKGVMPELCRLMLKGVIVQNDPRTIALLHDKRLLVALSDQEYMHPLVGEKTADILATHVIPSYHPAWKGREPETIPGKMVLAKRAIGGKSQGMTMVRLADYKERLSHSEQYVYQPRIRQQGIKTKQGNVEIAGTLPMTITGDVFGPGVVRVLAHNRLKGFFGFTVAARSTA